MRVTSGLLFILSFIFLLSCNSFPQKYKVIESTNDHLTFEVDFRNSYTVKDTLIDGRKFQRIYGGDLSYRTPGDPWLPELTTLIGIPHFGHPKIRILTQKLYTRKNQFIIPSPNNDTSLVTGIENFNKDIYSNNQLYPQKVAELGESYEFRFLKILPIEISPYQFNPVSRDLIFNYNITVRVDFGNQGKGGTISVSDNMSNEFAKNSLLNSNIAKDFIGKVVTLSKRTQQSSYWYSPTKNYFKIYLKEKGVYRITYEQLVAAGAQLGTNTPIDKLELFNNGSPVPIDIADNNSNNLFDEGDYFQFVGFPPTSTPYCTLNIYNLSNVYWFSYQSDSTGLHYINTQGTTTKYDRNYISNLQTIHYEKDSLYERLGYAGNDKRDNWYWDKATANNGHSTYAFQYRFNEFPDFDTSSNQVRLRIGLHGMTNSPYCSTDHKAYVSITDQPIGDIVWDGQTAATFDKTFYVSQDSIQIYPEGNIIKVEVKGDICQLVHDDEIRINWIEFKYWRYNRIHGKYYDFTNYDSTGVNRYFFWQWEGSDIHIYVPSKNKMIYYPGTSEFVQFIDTVNAATEYFCSSTDNFSNVDSIRADVPSNLRGLSNGADYIIITHSKFAGIANQLASFRANHFPDESIPNPRIQIVDVQQIYDEFSYGLLSPFALKDFVKYAFENWQSPAPSYVVLIGDMSYDYRGLLQSSRPNFIPSIPYYAFLYGQAVSDNLIVAVSGNDVVPDLAIGRLSMETVDEGNILLQKLFNYPEDNSKAWKENVLLLASGLSPEDEGKHGFNDSSLALSKNFLEPEGYTSAKVFRYPTTEQSQYWGDISRIRAEINKGAALVNYYGHGGGYQWDLTFLNDDIYQLENGGRLPLVLSVTCYTAHFDNQDIFGEQFNKVPGKGSIAFYGSSGLTYWDEGTMLNSKLFDEIFLKKNYIVGKAILNSKNEVPLGLTYQTQIALLTYLGDPVLKLALPQHPDFEINSSDIIINPQDPVLGDSVSVKININNLGIIFPNDSVSVELFAQSADSSYQISSTKLASFPEKDSVTFKWVPNEGGLITLTAKVNETNVISEEDHSDNIAATQLVIYNISEPNILKPVDGFATSNNKVQFLISDVGYYINKELKYYIEIDTSVSFASPLVSSGELPSSGPLLKWSSSNLSPGVYFWRSRIFDGTQYGRWSSTRSFSIINKPQSGYYAHGKILQTFNTYNINYSDNTKSLKLNIAPLPARPSNKTLLKDFYPDPQLPDSLKLTALTTDGTYLYFGNIWATSTDGKSMIYRVGTGFNNTIEGKFYGSFSNFRDSIKNTIAYHSDGNIYVAIGKAHKLVRINVATEKIDTVNVPPGLLRWDKTNTTDGPVYITSDGKYIYNITTIDSLVNYKYTVRTFDPANGWSLAKPDIVLAGSSFQQGITGFFVHGDYVYPVEYFSANYIRRLSLVDGSFKEEWIVMAPFQTNFQSYYSWCLDWTHDYIYASVYRASGFVPKFSRFAGYYEDATGTISTNSVGPVRKWSSLTYDLSKPSPTGKFSANLLGLNSNTKSWDTLQVNIPDSTSLSQVNSDLYPNLKVNFNLVDSSFTTTQPMELKSVNLDYQPLSDIYFDEDDFEFQQDSVLQGIPITLNFKARSIGGTNSDTLNLKFYQNGYDSLFYSTKVPIISDSSSKPIQYTIETNKISDADQYNGSYFERDIRVQGELNKREYFSFNNLIDKKLYIKRDTIPPVFSVKFDNKEILDGDIVSAKPHILITLKDNSPLPLTKDYFSIVFDNIPLVVADSMFSYVPYPNSEAMIEWNPSLENGTHTLEILAKDASNNFFDTTSYRISFNVSNEVDLKKVYNYPNPFKDDTYFTFQLTGTNIPDELRIRIFTVAGRLIQEILVPPSDLRIGFNKIHWNGRDRDGDEIANGLYFYKIISKSDQVIKTVIEKLAKIK